MSADRSDEVQSTPDSQVAGRLRPDKAAEFVAALAGTLDWLTFYRGWLDGYVAGGGDRDRAPVPAVAYEAFRNYRSERERESAGVLTVWVAEHGVYAESYPAAVYLSLEEAKAAEGSAETHWRESGGCWENGLDMGAAVELLPFKLTLPA